MRYSPRSSVALPSPLPAGCSVRSPFVYEKCLPQHEDAGARQRLAALAANCPGDHRSRNQPQDDVVARLPIDDGDRCARPAGQGGLGHRKISVAETVQEGLLVLIVYRFAGSLSKANRPSSPVTAMSRTPASAPKSVTVARRTGLSVRSLTTVPEMDAVPVGNGRGGPGCCPAVATSARGPSRMEAPSVAGVAEAAVPVGPRRQSTNC